MVNIYIRPSLLQKLDYISQLEAKQNVGNLQQPINQDQNMMGLNNNGEQALHQGANDLRLKLNTLLRVYD